MQMDDNSVNFMREARAARMRYVCGLLNSVLNASVGACSTAIEWLKRSVNAISRIASH
jgi:hypothetical protein